jgi:PII-like signaling protein
MANDVLMVRVYLSEAHHGRRKTPVREIFSILHDRHAVKGVTVFRGVVGFDASGEVHANDILRLNVDLPLVIEFFDEPSVAEAAIHLLDDSGRRDVIALPARLRSEAELNSRRVRSMVRASARLPRMFRG